MRLMFLRQISGLKAKPKTNTKEMSNVKKKMIAKTGYTTKLHPHSYTLDKLHSHDRWTTLAVDCQP
jgi:hypothetical protein